MNDDEKQQHVERAETLLSQQNFAAAAVVGAIAAVLAATAYGIVVVKWPVVYGFAAAAIGVVVGASMQFLGRGIETKFAVLAAVYTIAGCLLGQLCCVVLQLAVGSSGSLAGVFRNNSIAAIVEQARHALGALHLLYWFIAVLAAVFLARRPLSRTDRLAIGLYRLRDE